MKLSSWLSTLSPDTISGYSSVYLLSKDYQPVITTLLMQAIQRKCGDDRYTKIDLSEKQAEFQQQLAISFLGQSQKFWVGSLDALSLQQRSYWFNYCAQYEGPHQIWCHSQEKPLATTRALILEVPSFLEYDEFINIAPLFFPLLTASKCAQFRALFQKRNMIASDTACILMNYVGVVSVQHIPLFLQEWVSTLVLPEHSLFTLSSLFFAKDVNNFLLMWESIKQSYSIHFWITYWSEQLFRAYHYSTAQQMSDIQQAKKYAYRLPFSFIQRDWKKYSISTMRLLHQQLYDLDYRIKQGGDEQFFDLLLYQALHK